MIAETWGGFFTLAGIALAFFGTGWLWRDETAYQEEQHRAARRRAHRMRRESGQQ